MKKIFAAAIMIVICMSTVSFMKTEEGELKELPIVGNRENFIKLMKENDKYNSEIEYGVSAVESSAAMETMPSAPSEDRGMSDTNVQVEGVDEGDLLKNDGEYLYYANNFAVEIIKAEKDGSLTKTAVIPYQAQELYLYDEKLIVIGKKQNEQKENTYGDYIIVPDGTANDFEDKVYESPTQQKQDFYRENIDVTVYDISDKSAPKVERAFEFSGLYLSSRQIEGCLYLVSNQYIYNTSYEDEYILPCYSDSAGMGRKLIGYDEICYFPNFSGQNFLLTAAIPLEGGEADIRAYLGAGENIYVSQNYMYVAAPIRMTAAANGNEMKDETAIYKFSLDKNVDYIARGIVSGTPLNQFSMDEYNGNFRIATTEYDYDTWQQSNNMFVLDTEMKILGAVRNIAPSERIYSVRFMGERAYMVTFKQVDPLFALDLSDPENPKILGALKIPGYSDYLHPYDENHLIGFGKDTTEQYGGAYYKGMKMSFFDVTDPQNPKEEFVEYIGDRGTESELLSNHKALLFSKAEGMIAFPISIAEQENKTPETELDYGEFVFQGALVYHIDEEGGFVKDGQITHIDAEDYLSYGYYGGDDNKYIRRIAYIGDYYYTISNAMIQSHDRKTFEKKGEVSLISEGGRPIM